MPNTGRLFALAAAVALLLTGLAAAPAAHAAVMAGHVDNFEDGSVLGWAMGPNDPNPTSNVATGGPAGSDDNYLRITSNGNSGPGGKLAFFNTGQQWTGDYVGAGVDAIQLQVNNQGPTALTLRLIFANNLSQTVTTVADVNVPAGSGWVPATFPLTPGNLAGSAFSSVMSNVVELNLIHSPTVIPARSSAPNIAAQLGVDNITAVPEPAVGVAALMLGGGALAGRAPRRARRLK